MTLSAHANSLIDLHGHPLTDAGQPGPADGSVLLDDNVPGLMSSGFSFAPPPVHTTPPVQALYLTEADDTVPISANDIHQGQIGDCFLLSAIGEIALWNPAAIKSMIKQNSNGTETVSLWGAPQGGTAGFWASGFKLATQIVTNSFLANGVNNGATQDIVGNQKEIWPQVIEKAYAQANGGYGGIQNGGSPVIALQALTGHTATWQSPVGITAAALQADMVAGDLIVMDTGSGSAKYNLVGHHAYMFEGLTNSGGTTCVKLGNPWGFDQPGLIPVSQLSSGIVEIDIGHMH